MTASRLGELSAHFLSAIALVVPGVGPIVADGPLAARLAEVAGHAAGGVAPTLERAGLDRAEAEQWEARVRVGAVLVGAHVQRESATAARDVMTKGGAQRIADLVWTD